jgi:hypothetical protein
MKAACRKSNKKNEKKKLAADQLTSKIRAQTCIEKGQARARTNNRRDEIFLHGRECVRHIDRVCNVRGLILKHGFADRIIAQRDNRTEAARIVGRQHANGDARARDWLELDETLLSVAQYDDDEATMIGLNAMMLEETMRPNKPNQTRAMLT